jgi:hypothetical protein
MTDPSEAPAEGTPLPLVFEPEYMEKLTVGLAASISKWRLGTLTDGDRLLGVIYDERTMKKSTVQKYRIHMDMLQRFLSLSVAMTRC